MGKIGLDKALHFVVSLLVVALVALSVKGVGEWYSAAVPNWVCGAVGAGLSLLLGIGKEAMDYLQGRKFDTLDVLADGMGVLVGLLLTLMM